MTSDDNSLSLDPSDKAGVRPQSTLIFVAFIIFIDMAGIGLIIPVMPELLMGITGSNIARAAEIGGFLMAAYAAMQFLFAPIVGGLSDRFGRRPVLLITLGLLGLDYAIMAWAPTLLWLFIGRILSGIMGASWAAANSCIADVVDAKERGKYFGIMGGAGAMGFVIGPAIGGVLGEYGTRLPFVAVGTAIGIVILKETLPPSKRRRFSLLRANPLGSILQMAKTPLILGFLGVTFLLQLAAQSEIAIWSYYTVEKFQWSELEIGLSVTLFGILMAVVQGGLTGPAIARFGDRKVALYSLIFGLPAYFIFAFASAGWMMIAGIFVGALSAFAFPAMQQIMTQRVSEDAQGELQGAIASTVSITSIFGPVMMTSSFGAFADDTGLYFPGAPFLLSAFIGIISVLLYAVTVHKYYGAKG